jgi:hypothetical protein
MEFYNSIEIRINCKKNASQIARHKIAFDANNYFIFSTCAFTSSNEPSNTFMFLFPLSLVITVALAFPF